jgi:hypothetical protein
MAISEKSFLMAADQTTNLHEFRVEWISRDARLTKAAADFTDFHCLESVDWPANMRSSGSGQDQHIRHEIRNPQNPQILDVSVRPGRERCSFVEFVAAFVLNSMLNILLIPLSCQVAGPTDWPLERQEVT